MPEQIIFNEIDQERERQDRQWGGPEHDDEHSILDWAQFIAKQFCLVREDSNARQRFIKIAALAVAAVESYDRWQERIETEAPFPVTPEQVDAEEKRQYLIEVAFAKERKENLARNQRLRTARRVAAGLCVECEAPATRGQRCEGCAEANKERVRRSLAKKIKP